MREDHIELFDKQDCLLLPQRDDASWQVLDAPFIVVPLAWGPRNGKYGEFESKLKALLLEYFNPKLIPGLFVK